MAKKKKKKKLIEVKGTKFEKKCLILQIIDVVAMIIFMIAAVIIGVEEKVIMTVNSICLAICCFLMLLPQIAKSKK